MGSILKLLRVQHRVVAEPIHPAASLDSLLDHVQLLLVLLHYPVVVGDFVRVLHLDGQLRHVLVSQFFAVHLQAHGQQLIAVSIHGSGQQFMYLCLFSVHLQALGQHLLSVPLHGPGQHLHVPPRLVHHVANAKPELAIHHSFNLYRLVVSPILSR